MSKLQLPKDETPLVLIGDVMDRIKEIPDKSINLIVTSPPYWGQRDYGGDEDVELGKEKTFNKYVGRFLKVADELKRVLKDDGVFYLNIGDKYLNKNLSMIPFRIAVGMQDKGWDVRNVLIWRKTNAMPSSVKNRFGNVYEPVFFFVKSREKWMREKHYFNLDSVRVKHKTEGCKESRMKKENKSKYKNVKYLNQGTSPRARMVRQGRSMKVHELGKNPGDVWDIENKYEGKFKNAERINFGASPGARTSVDGEFYSRQRKHEITDEKEIEIIKFIIEYRKKKGITIKEIDEKFKYKDTAGHWFRTDGGRSLPKTSDWNKLKEILGIEDDKYDKVMTEEHFVLQDVRPHESGKNPGDVWDIATGRLKDSHFAVFPDELPRRAILSGCPEDGVVLDPFVGSGTTLKVARELGRKSVGIELQKDFLKIIEKRCGEVKVKVKG